MGCDLDQSYCVKRHVLYRQIFECIQNSGVTFIKQMLQIQLFSSLVPAAVDTFQVDVLHMVAVLREVLVLDTAAHTVHA